MKEPHLAGRWYPADAGALARTVHDLLAAGGSPLPGVVALVVPHAAYELSGATAAAGYAAAGAGHRRAVVLGPTHYADLHGAVVLPMGAYRTPLGTVPIDEEASAALARSPLVRANPAVFMREHTIEAQLPFWQTLAPDAPVVPLLVGALAPGEGEALAGLLRPLLVPGTLAVVSSDLVHYGRRFGYQPVPPTDSQAVTALLGRLGDSALEHLVAGDADGFARFATETGAPICGRHALDVLLRALSPDVRGVLRAHTVSLDPAETSVQAVTYAAVAYARAPAA